MAIIPFERLSQLRQTVAMVDGGFDPLHAGHVAYFAAAAALGLPVLCCMASDRYVATKHKPLLPQEARAEVLNAIRYIDYVVVNESTTAAVLQELQPRIYVKGKDWENRLPPAEEAICLDLGIQVVYLDTVRDSSTRILQRYLQQE